MAKPIRLTIKGSDASGTDAPTVDDLLGQVRDFVEMLRGVEDAVTDDGKVLDRQEDKEDKHFFVRKFPPKAFNLPRAYISPSKAENYISWWNGSGMSLVSLDRASTMGNGLDADYLVNDESKLCDRDKLKEVLLTIRGNKHYFEHLSQHHSVMFCSDMPSTSKGKWLLDYEQQMDKDLIEAIIQVHCQVIEYENILKNTPAESYSNVVRGKLKKWNSYLAQLRKQAVYISFASTLDNVDALGIDPIKGFKRMLSDLEFQTSVLNKRVLQAENGFYPLLDEDKHGYDSCNHGHIDTLSHREDQVKDVRWDADVQLSAPLDIAFDHNNAINSLVIGQPNDKEYRILNSLYVLKPEFIKDLVTKFTTYYRFMHTRTVNYYYDNTAVGGNARGDASFKDDVLSELHKAGWNVNAIYLGQATQHYTRYSQWNTLCAGNHFEYPALRFNRTNAHTWYTSCKLAGIVNGRDGFKKDKTSETDKKTQPEDATHLSEAGDCLLTGILNRYLTTYEPQSITVM